MGILNFFIFQVYQQAHAKEPLPVQLWNYFESSIFQGLCVSLLVPIFLFLLERRFKIIEKIQDERKEKQIQAIEDSVQKWNDFYGLTNEIIFFRRNQEKDITDILRRLDNTKSKTIDVMHSWKSRFRNIESEDITMLMYLDNTLYFTSKSVGHLIQQQHDKLQKQDKVQISKLQDALMIIQQVLGNQGHHLGLIMLDYFTELEHGRPSNQEKEKIWKEIKRTRTTLKNFTTYLTSCERKYNSTLTLEGEKKEEIQNKIKVVQDWLLENVNAEIGSSEFSRYENTYSYKELMSLFFNLPFQARAMPTRAPYSEQYIMALANALTLSTLTGTLRNRTRYGNFAESTSLTTTQVKRSAV
jgi:hypothetical protein